MGQANKQKISIPAGESIFQFLNEDGDVTMTIHASGGWILELTNKAIEAQRIKNGVGFISVPNTYNNFDNVEGDRFTEQSNNKKENKWLFKSYLSYWEQYCMNEHDKAIIFILTLLILVLVLSIVLSCYKAFGS